MRRFIPLLAALVALGLTTSLSVAGQDANAPAGKQAKAPAPSAARAAQEPAPAEPPTAHEPALGGYCPVAYVVMKQAVKGDPKISVVHEGHRYLLANADAKKMFEADPSKYHVAYDGLCATAMAMGKQMPSDPKLFTISEGATYLFSTEDAKKMWDADPKVLAAKADVQWTTIRM